MAVTSTILTSGDDTVTNGTVITTASISPVGNKPLLLTLMVNASAVINTSPTVTGNGLTWTQVTQTSAGARIGVMYRAIGPSPSAGALTFTSGDGQALIGAYWEVVQFSGAVITGTNASDAFINALDSRPATATSASVSFPATITAGNATYGLVGIGAAESPAAGTGWTQTSAFNHTSPNTGAVFMFAGGGQQNVSATWVTAVSSTVLGVEIVAGDVTAPTVPTGVTATANSSTSVTVAWTASTDAVGVASYRVRRGGVDVTGATAVVGTSFTDTSVSASTTYSYTVSAVDAAGNRSAESTGASVTTPATAPPPVVPPAPTPPAPDLPEWSGETRRMVVSVYQGAYQRVGQVPDYVSCSVTWQQLGVGAGELVVGEDDPIAPYLLSAAQTVIAVVVDVGTVRWSGRVSTVSLEREGPPGSGLITATLVDDWTWLLWMLASQGGASTSVTGLPQYDTRTGPAASVAADYINASAARLAVPVVAVKPSSDSSASVTLNARMTVLADLLTLPLKNAGVTMTAQIWLPGDPQPTGIGTPLTTATVVFMPRLLAVKPWLQWTDAMVNIVKMTFEATHQTSYRAMVGLSGTDAARLYKTTIDTTRKTAVGTFGLPEIYVDASDATTATADTFAFQAMIDTSGSVSAAFEVADADPWTFGTDYVVGDFATVVVNGASWQEQITQVTASDDRQQGLVLTPVLGERPPGTTGQAMMVRALARVAKGLRTVQSRR